MSCSGAELDPVAAVGAPVEDVPTVGAGAASEPHPTPTSRRLERAEPAVSAAVGAVGRNVLVVLVDDLASHQVQAYGRRPNQASTPTLTRLAEAGVKFTRAYGFASSTPSRAALLTGRYPTRSGLGNALEADVDDVMLPLAEVTIPEMLQSSPFAYHSAFLGKWHLTGFGYPGARFAPNDQGFDQWAGTLENLGTHLVPGPATDYFRWEKITNGRIAIETTYATTATTNDALAQTAQLPEPWFVVAGYHAPHTPLHEPPAGLHQQDLTGITCGSTSDPDAGTCYNAMLEAFDTELGRLLDTMDPQLLARTTVMVVGATGTPEHGTFPPYDPDRSKGTLFDGGVQIPFIVTGPLVTTPGSETGALVSVVDVFATVAAIAEVDLGTLSAWDGSPLSTDSVSFAAQLVAPGSPATPPRDQYVYSELFHDNGAPPYRIRKRMVRNEGYKLIRGEGPDQFYRYDPGRLDEGADQVAVAPPMRALAADNVELTGIADDLERTVVYEGP